MGRVILAISGDAMDAAAIGVAQDLAELRGSELVGIHVHPPGRPPAADAVQAWQAHAPMTLLEGFDVPAVLTKSVGSEDTVVLGTARLGTVLRLGSIAEGVLARAKGQVIVVAAART